MEAGACGYGEFVEEKGGVAEGSGGFGVCSIKKRRGEGYCLCFCKEEEIGDGCGVVKIGELWGGDEWRRVCGELKERGREVAVAV